MVVTFETKDYFLSLVSVSTSKCTGLWKPLIRKTNIAVLKLVQLLKQIKIIDIHELVDNLAMVGRNHPTEGDPTENIIPWLSVGGNIVIIVRVIVLVS